MGWCGWVGGGTLRKGDFPTKRYPKRVRRYRHCEHKKERQVEDEDKEKRRGEEEEARKNWGTIGVRGRRKECRLRPVIAPTLKLSRKREAVEEKIMRRLGIAHLT